MLNSCTLPQLLMGTSSPPPSKPTTQTFPKQESCDCQNRCRREVGNMELEGPEEAIRMRGEPGNLLCEVQREVRKQKPPPSPKSPPLAALGTWQSSSPSKQLWGETGGEKSCCVTLSTTLVTHRRIQMVVCKPKVQPGTHNKEGRTSHSSLNVQTFPQQKATLR